MALVAYGLSDSESEHSDGEDNEGGSVTLLSNTNEPKLNGQRVTDTAGDVSTGDREETLFNTLPQPKTNEEKSGIKEEEDEFLLKKEVATERPPVKIMIPSLADFESDDEDEPQMKKQKTAKKGSGLFAVLPPPKTSPLTTTSFVPNAVKKNTSLKPTQVKKPPVTKPTAKKPVKANESDDEDDVAVESFDDETWKQVCGRKKKPPKPIIVNTPEEVEEVSLNAAPAATEPYSGLDNEAFKKLVGSSKRHGNIKLIDLNEEEVKADTDLWMMKALTDPESKPKYVVENPVNDTCRKKHHITYLAEQAKANEQELQNQWSASRYSRMQTQAKYGF